MKKNSSTKTFLNLTLERKIILFFILLFLVLTSIYFLPFTLKGLTLDGDDFKYPKESAFLEFHRYFGSYNDLLLLGGGTKKLLQIHQIITTLFPAQISSSLVYIFGLLLMFIGSAWFFRNLKFALIPSLFSAWVISFSPMFFTYIRTGHIGKIYVVGLCMLNIAVTQKILNTKFSWPLILINAAFLSIGLLSGAMDTFVFFLISYLGYISFLLFFNPKTEFSEITPSKDVENQPKTKTTFLENIKRKKVNIAALALSGFLSLGLAVQGIEFSLQFLNSNEANNPYIPTEEIQQNTAELSPEQNWNWATQWSLPKLETIDLFVPGIFGLLSNNPTYPYWGRVGQTPGWENHRQGYRNYSLASNYLGVIFVLFLIYGLFYAPKSVRIFWGGLSLILLFLSYGRFSFLFEWFYQLPYANKIRNPNKFILVLYLTLSVLVGYGAQVYYLKIKDKFSSLFSKDLTNPKYSKEKFFLIFGAVACSLMGIGFLMVTVQKTSLMLYFSKLSNFNEANIVVGNIQSFLLRGIGFYFIASLILTYLPTVSKKTFIAMLVGLIFIAGFDNYRINEKFLNKIPIPAKAEEVQDQTAQILISEKKKRPFRFKIVQAGQYLNYFSWNIARTYGLNNIDALTVRNGLTPQYTAYFQTLSPELKHWRLGNVKYLLSQQPINHPYLALNFRGEYKGVNEQVFVYEITNTLPRIYMRGNIVSGNNLPTILGKMASPEFNINRSVMIHEKLLNDNAYDFSTVGEMTPTESIELKEFRADDRYLVDVNISSPKILVLANKFDKNWRATDQNGKVLQHFPVNYFFNGYLLKPDSQQVELNYLASTRDNIFTFITASNYLIIIFSFGWWFRRSKKVKNKKN